MKADTVAKFIVYYIYYDTIIDISPAGIYFSWHEDRVSKVNTLFVRRLFKNKLFKEEGEVKIRFCPVSLCGPAFFK